MMNASDLRFNRSDPDWDGDRGRPCDAASPEEFEKRYKVVALFWVKYERCVRKCLEHTGELHQGCERGDKVGVHDS